MFSEEERRAIVEIVTNEPFTCDELFLFEIRGEEIFPEDSPSRALLSSYRKPMEALLPGPKKLEFTAWAGGILLDGSTGYAYGGFRISNHIVAVRRKFLPHNDQHQKVTTIDAYFLKALQSALAKIIELHLADWCVPEGSDRTEKGLSNTIDQELRAFEQFRELWQRKYGKHWLAVKGGTVVVYGANRQELELALEEKRIESPVLYVPPIDEMQEMDFFTM